MRIPSDGATQQAIEHHYDISRDFYRLWLGPSMVYSSALWLEELDDDLEAAQAAKLAWHASNAGVDDSSRVLDVGCGWGAMLRYLRDEHQVRHATGLTLSRDQADAIEGGDDIDIRLEDWREHLPTAPYDAIISIGAFEHFARQELTREQRRDVYRGFFERCASWLVPGGRVSLQTIAYEDFDADRQSVSAFFTDEIFPESSLPSLSDIVVACEPTFRLVAFRSDGAQYGQTLRLWQNRLEASRDQAMALVDRATYRRYLRYLRVSRAMFDRRVCTLYRLGLERRAG